MSKVEIIRVYTPNSGEAYKEEKLIKSIKKIVSEYGEVYLSEITESSPKLQIKTSLRASQLGDIKLISQLNKLKARAFVSIDQDIWIECERPKTYPAYAYGLAFWFSSFMTILSLIYYRE